MEIINTLGRRKAAVARVYVSEGKGNITVNKREITSFFPEKRWQDVVKQGLVLTDSLDKYDIKVNVGGGGTKGQAEATRLAIARALIEINPEHRPLLKSNGLLTRDPRTVERKKPGQPKARKKFQFSKR